MVCNDNTVGYQNLILQLPPSRDPSHFVRCPVTVYQFSDGILASVIRGRVPARYDRGGVAAPPRHPEQGTRRQGARRASHLTLSPRLLG